MPGAYSMADATVAGRLRRILPHEILIFFILAVLLALCLLVAQVVIQDVDEPAEPPSRGAL